LFQRGGTAMAMERFANFSDEVTERLNYVKGLYLLQVRLVEGKLYV